MDAVELKEVSFRCLCCLNLERIIFSSSPHSLPKQSLSVAKIRNPMLLTFAIVPRGKSFCYLALNSGKVWTKMQSTSQ